LSCWGDCLNRTRRLVGALILLTTARGVSAAEVGGQVLTLLKERARVRVIVALREPSDTLDPTLRGATVRALQSNVLDGLTPRDFVVTHRYDAIAALGGEVSLSGLMKLHDDPLVLQVDVDPPAFAQTAESAALMRADVVHGSGITGRGVVVAVLDTGVDTRHPDIQDSLIAEQCFCTSPSGAGCCPNGSATQSGTGSAEDDQGHGTNVSGIITSNGRVAPRGIAPDAQLVAIKVLDRTGAGSSTSILAGLDYVITQRPEVKIVNLSLGLANLFPGSCDSAASFTTAFASAINRLRSRGTALFASTANNGSTSQIAVPACIQNAIAVGAVYDADAGTVTFGCTDASTQADKVACFSNSSSAVDLLAPGAPVSSAGVGGGVSTFLGTSQSCPEAAAVAALLLEARPSLSPDQVEAALKNTGVSITDTRNGLPFRRIDAKAAVDSVR
jgi:subtilisin family serine protease